MKTKFSINTKCTHSNNLKDDKFKGAISPLYMSTSYAFDDVEKKRYPRYFNTPNQEALAAKLADLENTDEAIIFSSGMAAIATTLLSLLKTGDHIVLQREIYGGTFNFIVEEFERIGINYSFSRSNSVSDFKKELKKETKVIFVETPSNPLMRITDLKRVVKLSKKHNLISVIDSTFASPVNQNPHDFGIDLVIHSATKYLGGHSDISAGVVMGNSVLIDSVFQRAKNYGGNLSEYTIWLLDRSIKTLGLRVKQQNKNAKKVASYLEKHVKIKKVFYPGLKSHKDYELAKSQMHGFGGMLSFELINEINALEFQRELNLIQSSMSLAGVESTCISPSLTSHALMSEEERNRQGISKQLIRLSCGIENTKDLINDLDNTLNKF